MTDDDTIAEEVAARAARRPTSGIRRTDLLRSTPGQWGVLLLLLVIAGLVVGLVTALSVRSRQQTLADLATSTGQVHTAAAEFHRSLSTADMAAAAAFLARDQDRATDRVRYETTYETSIGEAQSALASLVAARDMADDPARRNLLGTLPGRLSEYTVLVETARAYNRQGEPVASTYQLLAADAMRAHLLPAARELHQAGRARAADAQLTATSFPVLELVLIGLLLSALVTAQVWLRRRTNRMFNLGLVAATIAAAAMLAWTTAGAIVAGSHAERSAERGTTVGNALTDARITALGARSTEALLLVSARDGHDTAGYERRFAELRERLVGGGSGAGAGDPDAGPGAGPGSDSGPDSPDDSGAGRPNTGAGGELALAKAATDDAEIRAQIDSAAAAADIWLAQHDTLRNAAGSAQAGAVEVLLGSPSDDAFTTVDDSLGSAIDDVRNDFHVEVAAGRSALTAMTFGAASLAVFAALAAGAGIWQRLREYR